MLFPTNNQGHKVLTRKFIRSVPRTALESRSQFQEQAFLKLGMVGQKLGFFLMACRLAVNELTGQTPTRILFFSKEMRLSSWRRLCICAEAKNGRHSHIRIVSNRMKQQYDIRVKGHYAEEILSGCTVPRRDVS